MWDQHVIHMKYNGSFSMWSSFKQTLLLVFRTCVGASDKNLQDVLNFLASQIIQSELRALDYSMRESQPL